MKITPYTKNLYEYVCRKFPAEDDFLRRLNIEAREKAMPEIQISPEQLAFFQTLLPALGARYVLEIGSLAGYSTIGMAKILPDDGKIVAFELNPKYAEFIHTKAIEAGVDHKLQLHVGDAKEVLQNFRPNVQFDFVFIDAEKTGYSRYLELTLPLIRIGGMVCGDNTLAWGNIADANTTDKTVLALQEFNDTISQNENLVSCLLPFAQGMTLATKIR